MVPYYLAYNSMLKFKSNKVCTIGYELDPLLSLILLV
jgi:hypothetical protein